MLQLGIAPASMRPMLYDRDLSRILGQSKQMKDEAARLLENAALLDRMIEESRENANQPVPKRRAKASKHPLAQGLAL